MVINNNSALVLFFRLDAVGAGADRVPGGADDDVAGVDEAHYNHKKRHPARHFDEALRGHTRERARFETALVSMHSGRRLYVYIHTISKTHFEQRERESERK